MGWAIAMVASSDKGGGWVRVLQVKKKKKRQKGWLGWQLAGKGTAGEKREGEEWKTGKVGNMVGVKKKNRYNVILDGVGPKKWGVQRKKVETFSSPKNRKQVRMCSRF